MSRIARVASKIARWRERPERFVIEAIGATPDEWQAIALRALATHGRVSIAACHGVGKDALASWAVLWTMFVWPHPKIPCTAPTRHQIEDLLWAEIARWFFKMPAALRAMCELTSERFYRKAHKETWFGVGRTARAENSEALQGFHADHILVVVDEASGVPDIIFEVLEGALTGPHPMCLLIGNPTQTSGYFYDSHHTDRSRWHTMRILAEAAHDGSPLPKGTYLSPRVSADYCRSMERKYGRESNVYRVRVLGLFPRSGDDQTIPLEWVELASAREQYASERGAICIGGDIARFGSDSSAAVVREGRNVVRAEQWHGHDIAQTTGRFVVLGWEYEKRLSEHPDDRLYFFIDTVGLGAGVADNLRDYVATHPWQDEERGIPRRWTIIDVDSGRASKDPTCLRMRDYLWWQAREWFRVAAPSINPEMDYETLQELTAELASPTYGYTANGLIKIESKDEMKDRGIDSPNLADALIYTLFFDPMKPEPPKRGGWRDLQDTSSSDWRVA